MNLLSTFATFAVLALSVRAQSCGQDGNTIISYNRQPSTAYPYGSPFLQLFKGSTKVTCSGWLGAWEFLPARTFSGAHLAIFRQNGNSKNFKLIGQNRISYNKETGVATLSTRDDSDSESPLALQQLENGWVRVTVPLGKQFQVQAGDFIGLFYDSLDNAKGISYQGNDNPSPGSPNQNKEAYSLPSTSDKVLNGDSNVDASASQTVERIPALGFVIDANAHTTTTTTTTTTTKKPAAGTTKPNTTRKPGPTVRTTPRRATTKGRQLGTTKKGTTRKPTTRKPTTRRPTTKRTTTVHFD